jgi:hypothetical protein
MLVAPLTCTESLAVISKGNDRGAWGDTPPGTPGCRQAGSFPVAEDETYPVVMPAVELRCQGEIGLAAQRDVGKTCLPAQGYGPVVERSEAAKASLSPSPPASRQAATALATKREVPQPTSATRTAGLGRPAPRASSAARLQQWGWMLSSARSTLVPARKVTISLTVRDEGGL